MVDVSIHCKSCSIIAGIIKNIQFENTFQWNSGLMNESIVRVVGELVVSSQIYSLGMCFSRSRD